MTPHLNPDGMPAVREHAQGRFATLIFERGRGRAIVRVVAGLDGPGCAGGLVCPHALRDG